MTITCEYCGGLIKNKSYIGKHQATKKCQRLRKKKEVESTNQNDQAGVQNKTDNETMDFTTNILENKVLENIQEGNDSKAKLINNAEKALEYAEKAVETKKETVVEPKKETVVDTKKLTEEEKKILENGGVKLGDRVATKEEFEQAIVNCLDSKVEDDNISEDIGFMCMVLSNVFQNQKTLYKNQLMQDSKFDVIAKTFQDFLDNKHHTDAKFASLAVALREFIDNQNEMEKKILTLENILCINTGMQIKILENKINTQARAIKLLQQAVVNLTSQNNN